jgi:branched-chain amino acid transport system permease protein
MGAALEYLQFVLVPQMFNGMVIGIAVILMALGLTIIFGLLDVLNMAHGEFYALGAYLGLTLAGRGVSFWLLLLLVPLLLVPAGFLIDRALIQRVFHQKERHMLTLLLTFGLAIVLEDVFKAVYGANTLRPDAPISGGTELLGNFFPSYRLFLLGVGALTIAGVWLTVNRTRFGAMVRAASFDRHMAASLGVPVRRVYSMTFAFGVALAGLSGVLLAPVYSVFPTMGKDFILMAFTAVIVGGLGSIRGVVIAGLGLTQIQAVSSLYISPVWGEPLVFGIMVLVLMVRPQGIFGGKLGHA